MFDKVMENNMATSTKWLKFCSRSLNLDNSEFTIATALSRGFNISSYEEFIAQIELIKQKKSRFSAEKRKQLSGLFIIFISQE